MPSVSVQARDIALQVGSRDALNCYYAHPDEDGYPQVFPFPSDLLRTQSLAFASLLSLDDMMTVTGTAWGKDKQLRSVTLMKT